VVNTPAVDVANTPNVSVTNTPNVNVANTNPLPITGTVGLAENPARSAVEQQVQISLTGGSLSGFSTINIPANRILVLEFVSYNVFAPNGNPVLGIFNPGTQINGGPVSMLFFLGPIPPPDANGLSTSSQLVRLYAQGGNGGNALNIDLIVSASDPNNPPHCVVTLSGYLVNAQ
jgi:hypothetical protein